MKRFVPSRTYASPSRRAVVRIAAASEPAAGSVSAYAGEPLAARQLRQVPLPLLVGARELEREAPEPLDAPGSARSSRTPSRSPRSRRASSGARPRARRTRSSNGSPIRPAARGTASTTSHGNSPVASISAARGATARARPSRTSSRSSSWSGVSRSSIGLPILRSGSSPGASRRRRASRPPSHPRCTRRARTRGARASHSRRWPRRA